MGTASRKTWLEKQNDGVQIFVLALDHEGKPSAEIAAAVATKFELAVPDRTLRKSLARWHKEAGVPERILSLILKRGEEMAKRNPGMEPRRVVRELLLELAPGLIKGDLSAAAVMSGAQTEGWMDLRERDLKIKEDGIELRKREVAVKEQENETAREKIRAATGGSDGRELYLQAAQDVLKKLRTYQELKPGLDQRQEEIVAELAHSAESFARKLEHEA